LSKVAIEGNSSGTGTFTIASPNSNTNYSLSLPEEAGTITTSNSPYSTFRNRIINGDMRIDQRNAGASVTFPTGSNVFSADRWLVNGIQNNKMTIQQDSNAPTGFVNSLKITVTSAYTPTSNDSFNLQHRIEGNNLSDMAFGTASAKTFTLSFWVRSSLTGTFGGSLLNGATNRSYPFTYSISVADTWEYKTITVAGDTTGTWLTTSGIGLICLWSLGAAGTALGTAGAWAGSEKLGATGQVNLVATGSATLYITGVQLEVGSVATPFERRPFGTELSLCQRYYYRMVSNVSFGRFGASYNGSTTAGQAFVNFAVTMRSSPTALEQTGTAANYAVVHQQTSTVCSAVPVFSSANTFGGVVTFTVASGLVAGHGSQFTSASGVTTAYLGWSAEL